MREQSYSGLTSALEYSVLLPRVPPSKSRLGSFSAVTPLNNSVIRPFDHETLREILVRAAPTLTTMNPTNEPVVVVAHVVKK